MLRPAHTSALTNRRSSSPARLAAALLAISLPPAVISCAGGGRNQSQPAFDASTPIPLVGADESVTPAPPDLSAYGDDLSNMIDLDQYTRDRLRLQQHQREKAEQARRGGLDAAVNGADAGASPDRGIVAAPGGAVVPRPPVVWLPTSAPVKNESAVYSGPEGSANFAAPDANGLSAPSRSNSVGSDGSSVEMPPVLRLADLITPFKSQLAMQAADSTSPLREHLIVASLLMLDGQKRVDPATLYDLTDREREVLKAYQDHFVRLGEAMRAGGGAEAAAKDARELASSLHSEDRLRIAEFRLCKRIVNFGLFEEIESYKFAAMRPTPLLTYVEIDGFKAVPGGDGKYITRVRHELELYTERDGELVYAWPSVPAEDVCGKVRRDFFLPRQIQLPSNLTMGRYRLKVRIVDEQSQHQAESVISLSIVAGGDVAVKK